MVTQRCNTCSCQYRISTDGDEFLEGYKSFRTQNRNMTLNYVIWSLIPKEQYVSPLEMSPLLVSVVYVYSIMVCSIHIQIW